MLDLSQEFISWRKFTVLLGALSPESIFIQTIKHERDHAPIEDTDMIMRDMLGKMSKK